MAERGADPGAASALRPGDRSQNRPRLKETNDLPEISLVGRGQGTLHSKYAVLDRERALVASYNLDPELAGRLRTSFVEDDLKYGREVTRKMAARFEAPESVIERFRKSIGHLFDEHL